VRAASLAARFLTTDGFDNGALGKPAATADATVAGKGLSILCAEDNEINALLIRARKRRGGDRMLACRA
jgi:hypothetical protein